MLGGALKGYILDLDGDDTHPNLEIFYKIISKMYEFAGEPENSKICLEAVITCKIRNLGEKSKELIKPYTDLL